MLAWVTRMNDDDKAVRFVRLCLLRSRRSVHALTSSDGRWVCRSGGEALGCTKDPLAWVSMSVA